MAKYDLNWDDMAFGSKKPLKSLKAILIAPSREISARRFAQIVKQYLPVANLVVSTSDEEYVLGYEGQVQFKMLKLNEIKPIIDKVNMSKAPNKIYTLHYPQRVFKNIIESVDFKKVLLINGSWSLSFHLRPEYYALVSKKADFELISPFSDDDEAIAYDNSIGIIKPKYGPIHKLDEDQAMAISRKARIMSFDTSFQTGAALFAKKHEGYQLCGTYCNTTVPYRTFAWHHGAQREKNLAMPGDLTYYDAVHAEVMMLIDAVKQDISLIEKSLFIELLPCPTCARMLCETDIEEIVYSLDHSDGYAVTLLQKAGKTVRRVVQSNDLTEMED